VWWDPKLESQIARAGRKRLLAFHVCDWLVPTTDMLLDRGMMGDGVIDIRRIRGWMEAQGFDGYSEVEIFSEKNWWQREQGPVLDTCIARHRTAV
jgi:sugar phosphate isomerase/epimerase